MVQSATARSTSRDLAVEEPSFAIDQTTGQITTRTTLDRERTAVYHLTALAIDSRNTSMSASANVTVHVADTNDNKPVIKFPSASNYTVQVMRMRRNVKRNCASCLHQIDVIFTHHEQ